MKTALMQKPGSVRKTLSRLPREGRATAQRAVRKERVPSTSDPQVAEFERTFSVRWEW